MDNKGAHRNSPHNGRVNPESSGGNEELHVQQKGQTFETSNTNSAARKKKWLIGGLVIFILIVIIVVSSVVVLLTSDKKIVTNDIPSYAHHCQVDTPAATGCDEGWIQSSKSCYLFVRTLKTWDDAEAHCRLNSATLAEITDEEEFHFLSEVERRGTFWIGGRYSNENEEWINNCSNTLRTFTEHDVLVYTELHCLILEYDYFEEVSITNSGCLEEWQFICEGNYINT